jgi:anti-anti-sigma regulatory factor
MFEAEVDETKNLLKIHFSQHVDAAEAQSYANKIQLLLAEVKPGFTLLTDLTGLEAMDLACQPHIDQAMDRYSEAGLGMVVRVIPDPSKDIGLSIMSFFHYHRRVRTATCESLEEALKILASES